MSGKKKQKTKTTKTSVGKMTVQRWIATGQTGKRPIGALWYEPVHSVLARRIDSAIARRDRRAIDIVNKRLGPDTQAAKDIIEMMRSDK